MTTRVLICIAVALLAACAKDASTGTAPVTGPVSADEFAAVNGEQTYEEYCADCHETSLLGAPIAGDAREWEDRSQLWDAVLMDHALTGYFDMPAKGGRMELPDEVVKAAAEYMLEITFPNRLLDCNPPACTENGT